MECLSVNCLKDSHSTVGVRYFEGQLSDGKKTVRSVSFELKLYSSDL